MVKSKISRIIIDVLIEIPRVVVEFEGSGDRHLLTELHPAQKSAVKKVLANIAYGGGEGK